ncbi:Serine/threonine-protein kinase PrkC [Nocardioides dokdonensis FR1436]|uniref:non-specific serine/threonine protein kinase n=1 Tax=Nocardioides dokdonensis FR1436 TaxID=1300347 RepID=A0A1A9GJP0_9ACTN|nr:serine/threonine-protein kinase [Nocardioides dokdonensis]ANH37685.1 Serine/threonine-protein kinase PrkC [Nocardioides dokdonensis FR1436]
MRHSSSGRHPGHPGLPAPPPRRLAGRYELRDRVGSGAMGSVWRAWDHQQGRWVGAKVLGEHDAGLLLRFVREQSVRIDHPHVVAPTGWAAEDHLVVLTMDLVRGGSLDDLLREHGPLPESYVAVLLAQLLRALAAVHEAGVVHRDVKPANLLLEPTGSGRPHLRLGDFGVATLVDGPRLTQHPGVVGTDGYLAPEQVAGAAPDPRQDLYAAGVVVRELLTARTPRQQAGRPAPPGLLSGLVTSLTSPDAGGRPPSALAALERLHRLGVPAGTPWDREPRPPHVPDRLGTPPGPRTPGAGREAALSTRTVAAALCLLGSAGLCLVALVLLL